MAQVGVQYPSLQGLFSGPMAGWLGADQYQNAQKNDELNRQQSLEDLTTKQVNRPLDMQVKQMGLAKSAAELPGIFARSSQEQDKANMSRKTLDPAIQAELTKIAAQTTFDDLKNQEAQLTQLISNPNTPEQIRQTLLKARDYFPDLYKKRMELDEQTKRSTYEADQRRASALDVANVNKDKATTVANTNAAARVQAAAQKAVSMANAAAAGKLDPAKAAVALAFAAEQSDDPTERAELFRRSNEMELMAQKLKPAPQPQINTDAVGGGVLNPAKLPGPTAGVKDAPAQPGNDIQKAVTAAGWTYEPTKYDYRIGPDGKVQRKLKGK